MGMQRTILVDGAQFDLVKPFCITSPLGKAVPPLKVLGIHDTIVLKALVEDPTTTKRCVIGTAGLPYEALKALEKAAVHRLNDERPLVCERKVFGRLERCAPSVSDARRKSMRAGKQK
jgi:hypothetical protein